MKISVITATYNRKELLRETLESVQKTVLVPDEDISVEHIVWDDGSTDGTAEIFREAGDWKNVFYFRQSENRGQSYAKNSAIERARGDFIFMLDSDDIILQRTLYNFAKAAKERPDLSFFVADFLRVDANLRYLPGRDYYGWPFKNTEEILTAIFRGEHFLQNNVFFKKSLFQTVGGFDENLKIAEDLDLYIRFLLNGQRPLYNNFISHLYRCHSGNISAEINLSRHLSEDLPKLRKKYNRN